MGGFEVTQDGSGVMPLTLEGPVKDRRIWEEFKERLVFDPNRFTSNFDDICKQAEASDEPIYAGDLPAGFFGGPREMCGFKNLIFLFYDDPDLLEDILDTLCDLWITIYNEIQRRVNVDYFISLRDIPITIFHTS